MPKCSKCNKNIETTFLNKLVGTYVKKKPICRNCQKKLSKETK